MGPKLKNDLTKVGWTSKASYGVQYFSGVNSNKKYKDLDIRPAGSNPSSLSISKVPRGMEASPLRPISRNPQIIRGDRDAVVNLLPMCRLP